MKNLYTLPSILKKSFDSYTSNPALGTVGKKMMSYRDVETDIESLTSFFRQNNIAKGDRIAIFSHNMPNWGIVYLATVFYGAIVVPLLPDFNAEEIEKILAHAEVKMLFVSERLESKTKGLGDDIKIFQLNTIQQLFSKNEIKENSNYEIFEEDLAAIIYTSGTTGNPKGVMLTHKNISSNVVSSAILQPIFEEDRFLSILPLSHTYENSLSFLLPLYQGASVHYLDGPPTPSMLSSALKKVKPSIINSVPMIIEKVYRKQISPQLTSAGWKKALMFVPFTRKALHKLAGIKLMKAFGGNIRFFGVGGAKLDPVVERFLKEAGFPYAIGYGLTETAPLVAGTNPKNTKLRTIGPSITDVEIEIRNENENGEGEIWVKGPNVMKGYYKMPDETNNVLQNNWFNTGDLGTIDNDGYLELKGRKKNIIIGSNGENIYPEDIESVINNFRHVVESVVVEKKGKLVALVHFNKEELEKTFAHMHEEISQYVDKKIDELRSELLNYINSKVNKVSRVQYVYVQSQPFQKTPTQKIKRFLYQ